MPLTELQVPWTGPYGLATGPNPSKGPTVEAMKRALSRAGAPSLPWADFDPHYNLNVEKAWDWYEAKHGIEPQGNGYGKGRWNLLRNMRKKGTAEYALDLYGRKLIQDEAGSTSDSTDLERFQGYCVEFCNIALNHASQWRYNSEIRPVRLNQNPADPSGTSDCSGSIIQITDYARRKANLVDKIADPSKQNWTGYGNTDWWMDDWPKIGSPFRVGDIAHFFNSRHVIFCIKPGTIQTAEWWSFGHEPPVKFTLPQYYRFPSEYMFTVRPDYMRENV